MTYSFKEETSSSSSKNGAIGLDDGHVETTVKKSQVVKTSTGQQRQENGHQEDSSLNNVVVDIGNRMIPDCIDLLASNKKDKANKSVRLAESNSSHTQQLSSSGSNQAQPMASVSSSSNQTQQMASGSTSQFYSYSASSSKKQVIASSTTVADTTVDYSRINKKQVNAGTQKQLDNPVCNFPVFSFFVFHSCTQFI